MPPSFQFEELSRSIQDMMKSHPGLSLAQYRALDNEVIKGNSLVNAAANIGLTLPPRKNVPREQLATEPLKVPVNQLDQTIQSLQSGGSITNNQLQSELARQRASGMDIGGESGDPNDVSGQRATPGLANMVRAGRTLTGAEMMNLGMSQEQLLSKFPERQPPSPQELPVNSYLREFGGSSQPQQPQQQQPQQPQPAPPAGFGGVQNLLPPHMMSQFAQQLQGGPGQQLQQMNSTPAPIDPATGRPVGTRGTTQFDPRIAQGENRMLGAPVQPGPGWLGRDAAIETGFGNLGQVEMLGGPGQQPGQLQQTIYDPAPIGSATGQPIQPRGAPKMIGPPMIGAPSPGPGTGILDASSQQVGGGGKLRGTPEQRQIGRPGDMLGPEIYSASPDLSRVMPLGGAPPPLPQGGASQDSFPPNPGEGFTPPTTGGGFNLDETSTANPAFNSFFDAILPMLQSGQLTNQPGFAQALNQLFSDPQLTGGQFPAFQQGLQGFQSGNPLQDQISRSLSQGIGGGGNQQGQALIQSLFNQPSVQSLSTGRASSGFQDLLNQQQGGGQQFNLAGGGTGTRGSVAGDLMGQPSQQSLSTGRASQGLSDLSRGNQLSGSLGQRAGGFLDKPLASSDFGSLQGIQAPQLNQFQAQSAGGVQAPTLSTPQTQQATFQGPSGVGAPNIQGQVGQSISGTLQGGGINPAFAQAARENILQPQQRQLTGQLNNQLGGVGQIQRSGLSQGLLQENERNFNNQLILAGQQNLQNAQQQGAQLGGQQFGQGLANQNLFQQAGQQQAQFGQQSNLANLQAALQTQGLGSGQNLQAQLANAGFGQQTNLANLQSQLQTQGLGAGQNLQAQLANMGAAQGQQQFDLNSLLQQAQLGGGFQNQLFQQPLSVAQSQGQLGQNQQQINQQAIGLGNQLQQQGFGNLFGVLQAQGQLGQNQQQINQNAFGVGGQLQNQFAQQQLQNQQMGLGREQFLGQFGQQNVGNALQGAQQTNQFNQGNLGLLTQLLQTLGQPDPAGMAGPLIGSGVNALGSILGGILSKPDPLQQGGGDGGSWRDWIPPINVNWGGRNPTEGGGTNPGTPPINSDGTPKPEVRVGDITYGGGPGGNRPWWMPDLDNPGIPDASCSYMDLISGNCNSQHRRTPAWDPYDPLNPY